MTRAGFCCWRELGDPWCALGEQALIGFWLGGGGAIESLSNDAGWQGSLAFCWLLAAGGCIPVQLGIADPRDVKEAGLTVERRQGDDYRFIPLLIGRVD